MPDSNNMPSAKIGGWIYWTAMLTLVLLQSFLTTKTIDRFIYLAIIIVNVISIVMVFKRAKIGRLIAAIASACYGIFCTGATIWFCVHESLASVAAVSALAAIVILFMLVLGLAYLAWAFYFWRSQSAKAWFNK